MPSATVTVDAVSYYGDFIRAFDKDELTTSISDDRFCLIWTDSTPGVYQAWKTFAADYSLGDYREVTHATHGRRLYDTLKEFCKIGNETRLLEEIDRFENEVIEGGPTALPGAVKLVSQLDALEAKWTIVTSASNKYAPRALEKAGVSIPKAGLITANDVAHGKPDPAPYLAGAAKCGIDASACLVVEDAISGLKSGRAAGAKTLAVCTSTEQNALKAKGEPDYIIKDLTCVTVERVSDGKLKVRINEDWA